MNKVINKFFYYIFPTIFQYPNVSIIRITNENHIDNIKEIHTKSRIIKVS